MFHAAIKQDAQTFVEGRLHLEQMVWPANKKVQARPYNDAQA